MRLHVYKLEIYYGTSVVTVVVVRNGKDLTEFSGKTLKILLSKATNYIHKSELKEA